jgi:hypothetical protein
MTTQQIIAHIIVASVSFTVGYNYKRIWSVLDFIAYLVWVSTTELIPGYVRKRIVLMRLTKYIKHLIKQYQDEWDRDVLHDIPEDSAETEAKKRHLYRVKRLKRKWEQKEI